MHIDAAVSTAYICNDLPWDQAYEHVLKMPHHSAASFSDPVRQVAYGEVPISYIVCENDMIIAPNVQRKFVQVLEEANQDVHVVSFDCGHCPNFSKPEEVADILAAEVDRD
jgi:pimeloyl-ACP methyl ester carboxylesterase